MTRARALPIQISSPLLMPSGAHAQIGCKMIRKWFGFVSPPQRRAYTVARFVLVFFLLSSPCFGQAWSNIISPGRAIDWTGAGLPPTLPDGETTPNPWTPPTRVQCTSYSGYPSAITGTGNAATDAAALNAALVACKQGSGRNGVYIPITGTFNFGGTASGSGGCYSGSSYYCIEFYSVNGVTLRGSGPQSTFIDLSGGANIPFGGAFGNGSCSWTAGYAAGTTSITVTGCSGPALAANQVISLQQCDSGYSGPNCTTGSATDNGWIYVCGFNTACQRGGEGTGNIPEQVQNVLVTSVTGACSSSCTVHFTPGIYLPNWTSAQSPTIAWQVSSTGSTPYGNGLEDLTVYTTGSTTNDAVSFDHNYASWIKGVRFVGAGALDPLYVYVDKNCLVTNNYMFSDVAIDGSYPSGMREGGDSDDLVVNNFMASGIPWEGTGSMEGDVIAYNFTRDEFTSYVLATFEHNAGDAYLLYEGNQTPSIQEDDTHGTHDLETLFRNQLIGWEAPYASSNYASTDYDAFDRFTNTVGNVMGSPFISLYQSTYASRGSDFVYDFSGASSAHSDPLTLATALRWANYDTVTGAVRYCGDSSSLGWSTICALFGSEIPTALIGNAARLSNAIPSTTSLPCSFFLAGYASTTCTAHPSGGTGLSFWKVCTSWTAFPTSCATTSTPPFPPAGPDVSGGHNIDGYAYDIPASVAFQKLPIDATYQISHSITSSSWSGGTEILTISGLPNIEHLMGPFQISGGACSTGAGEAYMTTSSSATISYALASDPGSCAGGTFKFPDVRQFDERVYMADGGGVGDPPPPTPPTNVTATVE
jgi:hypothetical protein